jgi:predicted O-methyltransferase YrrM
MHSPFFFRFIREVLNDHYPYSEYEKVESLREKLLSDQRIITINDLGAGSSIEKLNQRTVSSIARYSAKSKKLASLLFRIVKKYQPQTVIELGTSLGLTTSYFSLAKPDARIITIEGSPEVAEIAEKNFKELGLKNISVIKGNFDDILPEVLKQVDRIGLAFIDGNHLFEPTRRYFEMLLDKCDNDSILVFDDIHWSAEMENAWEHIKNHSVVKATLDLFFIGLVFFRQEFKEKQHFRIRF